MTKEEQEQHYKEIDEQILNITKSKREDYSTEDILSVFKDIALASKALNLDLTNSKHIPLFMVLLKISRITNLMKKEKTPENESLKDSYLDAINYMKLGYCSFLE